MMAQRQLNCSGRHAQYRNNPVVPGSMVRQRSSLVLRAGGLATFKRGMSMICQMLHGNGADANGADEAPKATSAPVSSAPAAYDPFQTQAEHNRNGLAFIKVVGCGGGGGNAVARMINSGIQNIEFWAINTDKQALDNNVCPNKLQIGTALTRGLGTGGKPSLGEQAAQESVEDLAYIVAGADMLFITAGMGGGTGTGSAPVIARLAKDAGILTVGVVTQPFSFEGRKRALQALEGIETLRRNVDTLIVIPNDRLLNAIEGASLTEAFGFADSVLSQGVSGISDMITTPGLVNVDFADIKAIMHNSGTAMLGLGGGKGPDRALQAAHAAIHAPLLQSTIERATGIVYNIEGSSNLTLSEVNTISEIVNGLADPSCNIIFGAYISDSCAEDEIHVTIIATGFSQQLEDELLSTAASGGNMAAAAARAAAAAAPAQAPVLQQQRQQVQQQRQQGRSSTGFNLL